MGLIESLMSYDRGQQGWLIVSCECRYGRRSWKPWLLSLAVDVASGHLSNLGAKVAQKEIKSEATMPGLSTSGSMLLLYSLQAFKYAPVCFVSHVSSVTGVRVRMYAPSICSQPSSNLILSVDYDTSCRALPLMSTTTHRLRTEAFSRDWTMMLTLSVWSACTAAGAWLDLDTLFVDLQVDSSRAAGAHTPQTVDHVLPHPQPLL